VSTTERARAIATIAAAFIGDPVTRWAWPDAGQYLKAMPGFIEAFGGRAFENGSAYADPKLRAAALWLGPGIEPDGERMDEILEATVSPELREELSGFTEVQSANHPHEAHQYLAMIGVDPTYQGRGLGGALLAYGLAISDKTGLPSYLEATSEGNRRLYERHGFVVVNEIQYGSSPPMWGMWREVR
jgi:ribosomal protein S18 acetylase RimI-like enzyme